jgi:succinate-acetate transporter protein
MSSIDSSPPVRVVLRPIGSAVPLGFFGLAVASFVYAGLQLGWAPASEGTLVGAIVLAVAVPLQAVAAVMAFAARDGATGTSMGLQAGAWAAVGVAQILTAPGLTPESFGLLLLAAGGLLVVSALGSGMGKLVVGLAVATLGARFLLSGLYEVSGSSSLKTAAGIVGLVVTGLAAYAALALEVEDARGGRALLPALRVGRGRAATDGSFAEQVREIAREPGVRQEL